MRLGLDALGVLHTLAFWALVFVAVWLLVRALGRTSRGRGTALDILDERYARGETDKTEYEQRRAGLLR